MEIKIATRPSKLARQQADQVATILKIHDSNLKVKIIEFKTQADIRPEEPISSFGGKGIFIKELEQAILDGEADIAVHSVKDLPSVMPKGFILAAVLPRSKVNDVLVSREGKRLSELHSGAKIGTSSPRRKFQIEAIRSDVICKPIRGNIDTRINKLQDEYDAIVLAQAGLERINLEGHICETFSLDDMTPAAGQGAIGIECHKDNIALRSILKEIDHTETYNCIANERILMAELGGHCLAPIAAYSWCDANNINLTAKVFCSRNIDTLTCTESQKIDKEINIGLNVAAALNAMGAQDLIKEHTEGN